jgi:uncharacterized protein (TIGR02117 family)
LKRLWLPLLLLGLIGCAHPGALISVPTEHAQTVSVVEHGWHTDVALPAEEAVGGLAIFRTMFPGARTLMFGFGKRTFMIAPVHSMADLVIGPFPGNAAVQVSAVSVSAAQAFPDLQVATLPMSSGGATALSDFIWQTITHDVAGQPKLIAKGPWPGSLFFASTHRYSLLYTCNSWTASALRHAGVPMHLSGVFFANQVMNQLHRPAIGSDIASAYAGPQSN